MRKKDKKERNYKKKSRIQERLSIKKIAKKQGKMREIDEAKIRRMHCSDNKPEHAKKFLNKKRGSYMEHPFPL